MAWLALCQPLLAQDRVEIFVGPTPLEPEALAQVAFVSHPQTFGQLLHGRVLRIGVHHDPVQRQAPKQIIEQTRERLGGEPLPLPGSRERNTDRRLPAIRRLDPHPAIAYEFVGRLERDGDLQPFPRHSFSIASAALNDPSALAASTTLQCVSAK